MVIVSWVYQPFEELSPNSKRLVTLSEAYSERSQTSTMQFLLNISRARVYQGVRTVSFLEHFASVLNQ